MEGLFAPWHVIIVGLLIVVVFGSKRLPESARAVGQSLRILKAETHELREPSSRTGGAPATTDSARPSESATAHPVDDGAAGPLPRVARYDPYTGRPLPGSPGSAPPQP